MHTRISAKNVHSHLHCHHVPCGKLLKQKYFVPTSSLPICGLVHRKVVKLRAFPGLIICKFLSMESICGNKFICFILWSYIKLIVLFVSKTIMHHVDSFKKLKQLYASFYLLKQYAIFGVLIS